MTNQTPPRKTLEEFDEDLRKLERLNAPAAMYTYGSDRDIEYRKDRSLTYALQMIGHLLQRIELLEAAADGSDGDHAASPNSTE